MPRRQLHGQDAPKRRPVTETDRRIGERLRAIREHAGLTQAQVGERLNGMQAASVGHYESGRSALRVADFPIWAKVFGMSESEFEHRLGLGIRPQMDDFAAAAASKLGPDQGELLSEVVAELADWPERERQQILDMLRIQTRHWHDRETLQRGDTTRN